MTIHIDPDNIKIRGPLPKERPVLRRPNIATLDNLLEAIDDGDIESHNHEDGLPTERTWVRIVNLARRLEAGK